MIPIPEKQQMHLKNSKANFSLIFPRLVRWEKPKGDFFEAQYDTGERTKKGEIIYDSSIIDLLDKASKAIPNAAKQLSKLHDRQKELLKSQADSGFDVFEFHATLISPYVSGLGFGHPTETGMILDRNTGLPFIPASGIKGVLRLAHALDLADKTPDIVKTNDKGQIEISDTLPTMRKFFGDTIPGDGTVRGQLVFLDAFPTEDSIAKELLKADIMTPHFSNYYKGPVEGKKDLFKGPIETELPNPIKFLTVKEGVEFVFRCFVSPLTEPQKKDIVEREWTDNDSVAVEAMFRRGFEKLGLGAKTAIGYGRFKINKSDIELIGEKRAEIENADKTKLIELYRKKEHLNQLKISFYNALERLQPDKDLEQLYQTINPLKLIFLKITSSEVKDLENFKGLRKTYDQNYKIFKKWLADNSMKLQSEPNAQKIFSCAIKNWNLSAQQINETWLIKDVAFGWEDILNKENVEQIVETIDNRAWPPIEKLPDAIRKLDIDEKTKSFLLDYLKEC